MMLQFYLYFSGNNEELFAGTGGAYGGGKQSSVQSSASVSGGPPAPGTQ